MTLYTLWVVELHDIVAVPDPVTPLGVMDPQVSPVGTVSEKLTTPANPFNPVIVTVDIAVEPTVTDAGDEAARVKSWKLNVIVVIWTRDPLVPVTVTVYDFAVVALHEIVAVPEPVTLGGEIVPQLTPLGTVSVRATVPVNPFRPLIVIVVVAGCPTITAAGGVAEIAKPGPEVVNCEVYQFVFSSWNW